MFTIANPHQFFEKYDDDDVLMCRWTMDKIKRKDSEVWVMNHFFINPCYREDEQDLLQEEMNTARTIAHQSGLKIWPLDPLVIAYFAKHPELTEYWYHRPASN